LSSSPGTTTQRKVSGGRAWFSPSIEYIIVIVASLCFSLLLNNWDFSFPTERGGIGTRNDRLISSLYTVRHQLIVVNFRPELLLNDQCSKMVRTEGTLKLSHCFSFVTEGKRGKLGSWRWASFATTSAVFAFLVPSAWPFPLYFWKCETGFVGHRCDGRVDTFMEYSDQFRRSNHELGQRHRRIHRRRVIDVALFATKKSKKQQLASGTKGFGTVVTTKTSASGHQSGQSMTVEIDRSRATRAFYETTLESQKGNIGSDNLKRTALAYSYNASLVGKNDAEDVFKLRGVVATRDISKGQELISIPYELSVDLGPEGSDPTIPALAFLKDYCSVMSNASHERDRQKQAYYRMLPPVDSTDTRGCTNFFSETALQALQSPYIEKETMRRRLQIQQCFERELPPDGSGKGPVWFGMDGTSPISIDQLTWAVWIITSRVLTVQTGSANDEDDGPIAVQYRRLLIPYLDMCNHDRDSKHVLTGRATAGGLLKIVAGANVPAGVPVEICYGGGMVGNDRFLQDYGFLDFHVDAFKFVAMDLLGVKRRSSGSETASLSLKDRQECLDALRTTTTEEDEAILSNMKANKSDDRNVQTAIHYRIGVKKALRELKGDW
jgi:SET domain